MKFFGFEISLEEIWQLVSSPFKKFELDKIKKYSTLNNILWEYKIPRLKRRKNVRKEDISDMRPLCRKCKCELRNDFSYPIERTTYRTFAFTCPNCNLVHNITAETLRDYFSDLVRNLAYGSGEMKENWLMNKLRKVKERLERKRPNKRI